MSAELNDLGGGWFEVTHGDQTERVRGREAAEQRLAELSAGDARADESAEAGGVDAGEAPEESAGAEPAEKPSEIPGLGETVAYREHAPPDRVVTRAALVIAVDPSGRAELCVLTTVAPSGMVRRPLPVRLASAVRYSEKPVVDTWGFLEE